MTRVRLPTTPVPSPTQHPSSLDGAMDELVGLLVLRDDAGQVAQRVASLQVWCHGVLVVDDGSKDDTVAVAEAAGARVFRLPAPRGEGAALRAGMRLARELGYIGAVCPGDAILDAASLEALCVGHLRAPEALVMGVGPGQALAGKEWAEARAVAEGREPEPYPDWRPPKAAGLPGKVEEWFEKLAETRYAYPWGGPRILPLQAVLRRDLRDVGEGIHLEILALAVVAGIPTVELELPAAPVRPVVSCRRASLRLLGRIVPMTLKARGFERLGLGGGYAPPTTSPLQLLLAASIAVAAALMLAGCPRPAGPPLVVADCEQDLPRVEWPGAGDAIAALAQFHQQREGLGTVWAEQGVVVTDPSLDGPRKLRGVLVLAGLDRLRLRLLGPMGVTVLDYVEVAGDWQLSIPTAGIFRRGGPSDPIFDEEADGVDAAMVRPDLVARLLHPLPEDSDVRWQAGSCAILEQIEADAVVRRLVFQRADEGWVVGAEQVLDDGQVRLAAAYDDYRGVDGSAWPHRSEITDPDRGSVIVLETKKLRTEGVTDAFFAMQD